MAVLLWAEWSHIVTLHSWGERRSIVLSGGHVVYSDLLHHSVVHIVNHELLLNADAWTFCKILFILFFFHENNLFGREILEEENHINCFFIINWFTIHPNPSFPSLFLPLTWPPSNPHFLSPPMDINSFGLSSCSGTGKIYWG